MLETETTQQTSPLPTINWNFVDYHKSPSKEYATRKSTKRSRSPSASSGRKSDEVAPSFSPHKKAKRIVKASYSHGSGDEEECKNLPHKPLYAGSLKPPVWLTTQEVVNFSSLQTRNSVPTNYSPPLDSSPLSPDGSPNSENQPKKLKPVSMAATRLEIGDWKYATDIPGGLVCKIYYTKRQFVWEMIFNGLKSKIEVPFSLITALDASGRGNSRFPSILVVDTDLSPRFYQEVNPTPKRNVSWKECSNFVGNPCNRLITHFEGSALKKGWEKLLNHDPHIASLAAVGLPRDETGRDRDMREMDEFFTSSWDDIISFGEDETSATSEVNALESLLDSCPTGLVSPPPNFLWSEL